jgi:hypothetical protein
MTVLVINDLKNYLFFKNETKHYKICGNIKRLHIKFLINMTLMGFNIIYENLL